MSSFGLFTKCFWKDTKETDNSCCLWGKNWLLKDHKWEKEFSKINKQKINNGERTVCLYNRMPNKNMYPMAMKRIRTTQCPQIW